MPKRNITLLKKGGAEFVVIGFDKTPASLRDILTEAEMSVCEMVLDEVPNAEIARRRRTSERTVEHQIHSIFQKLQVGGRRELLAALRRE